MEKMENRWTCNQCGEQLIDVDSDNYLLCCKNPKCPNYALMQVPQEEMPE